MGLVVGRKPGEKLVIVDPTGQEVTVEVVLTDGGSLRLKIDAPKSFKLIRGELYHGHKDVATQNT